MTIKKTNSKKNPVKIFVAGHRGMVGSSIVEKLTQHYQKSTLNYEIITRSHKELDLTEQLEVRRFFYDEKPDQVYLAAAKVGGIHANNTYPAEFIYQNLMIQTNVIESAFRAGVKKLLFLGSSCIYPKLASQPMTESDLLTGKLEPTNEPYAIAKIAGIKLCESYNRQFGISHNIDYRSAMPTNLFGPNDNYHPENSHVIPALIMRFHEAKINNFPSVSVWGSGRVKREFLYVEDMADACIYVMNTEKEKFDQYNDNMCSHINIGTGKDIEIKEIAKIISEVVGFNGEILFDRSKPDGAPRKLLNVNKINSLGWSSEYSLKKALKKTYLNFLEEHK